MIKNFDFDRQAEKSDDNSDKQCQLTSKKIMRHQFSVIEVDMVRAIGYNFMQAMKS